MKYYLVGEITSHQAIQDTYIKCLRGTSMFLRALKVLLKWETTVGTTALSFAVTSLCSDFPWLMVLSAEGRKTTWHTSRETTRRKPSEQNPSYTKCRTVQQWTSPTEISQILLLRQAVGGCSLEKPPIWLNCYCACVALGCSCKKYFSPSRVAAVLSKNDSKK